MRVVALLKDEMQKNMEHRHHKKRAVKTIKHAAVSG